MGWVASPHHPVPAGRGVSAEPAAGLGGKRCPRSRAPRCAGWCGRCCPGSGSGRVSCCDGLRTSSGATNDRGALMRSGVPPDAGKAQESLLEAVVVILEGVPLPLRTLRIGPGRRGCLCCPFYCGLRAGANAPLDTVPRGVYTEPTLSIDEVDRGWALLTSRSFGGPTGSTRWR